MKIKRYKHWFVSYLIGVAIATVTYVVTIDGLKKQCDIMATIELKGTQYVCTRPSARTLGLGNVL